jgi:hypothetical protein
MTKGMKVCCYREKKRQCKTEQELMKKVRVDTQRENSVADENWLSGERDMIRVTVSWETVGWVTVLKNNLFIIKFQ